MSRLPRQQLRLLARYAKQAAANAVNGTKVAGDIFGRAAINAAGMPDGQARRFKCVIDKEIQVPETTQRFLLVVGGMRG